LVIRFSKIFIVFLLVLVGLFLIYPTVSNAAGLVPCGRSQDDPSTADVNEAKPCTTCDIFALVSRVMNFVLFTLVPAIAVLSYLIAGFFILFGGAKPALIAKGKSWFWDTTIGLLIMFGAWMITNSVLKSLAGDSDISNNWYKIECTSVAQQPPATVTKYACDSGGQCVVDSNGQYATSNCDNKCQAAGGQLAITTSSLPDGTVNQNYSQTLQATGGETPYTWSKTAGDLPPGLTLSTAGAFSGKPTTASTYTFSVKVEDSTTPTKRSATKQLSIKVTATAAGATCMFSSLNLCQGNSSAGCSNSSCSQYAAAIDRQASGAATANVLKAFMEIESSCNINSVSGSSYGLMQLSPSTANKYKPNCGVMESITGAWLTNSANAEKSICIAAAYINAIAQSQCGSSVRNMYAGYNGGEAGSNSGCAPSVSCAGEINCAGEPVRKWECLYDDTAHTVCNGDDDIMSGFNQTKQGATKIIYCSSNPGF
jgi:hypothetical protein